MVQRICVLLRASIQGVNSPILNVPYDHLSQKCIFDQFSLSYFNRDDKVICFDNITNRIF